MSDTPSHPILAATLDIAMAGMKKIRTRLVPQAEGDVLEIGVGTGANFVSYEGIRSLAGVEPDPHMLKRARRRAEQLDLEVRIEQAGAESLPFDDDSFDTVVATFVLCTIPDPEAALAEAKRVLRPGGVLLFAEHVKSSHRVPCRMQEMLNPVWRRFAGGCQLTRDAVGLIDEAGFFELEHRAHGDHRFTLTPVVSGRARG